LLYPILLLYLLEEVAVRYDIDILIKDYSHQLIQ
jgi:hypothetical protein